MQVTFQQMAPDGDRFAPDAFSSQVGKEAAFNAPGMPAATGTLTAAQVSGSGTEAWLTADIPDDSRLAMAIAGEIASDGPFKVWADGIVSCPLPLRRRDPADAAGRIRAGCRERGLPGEAAEALIAELGGD